MKVFGLPIPFTRQKALSPPDRGWHPLRVLEPFIGAWQKDVEIKLDSVLSFHAVFACQTLIASDISKLRIKLVKQDADGIWSEVSGNRVYAPVLRKPNSYQNRMQFIESWILSKLQNGNTYVLKQRDGRNVVVGMHILDPNRCQPMIADNGDVFYELQTDRLAGLPERILVPAREIIHDRFNCFFHSLVGLSPIFANGLAATNGLGIQNNSARFFKNGSMPGGLLLAPGRIEPETAEELKEYWQTNFTGSNRGKIAVLGDNLKYQQLAVTAVDAQLVEQLKWSAEVVCSTYHVPPYKAGIGQAPAHNNIQALNVEYYSQCLQVLIEALELCLDEGLGTGEKLGTELDTEQLLRMDSVTQMEVLEKAKNLLTLDERRKRAGYGTITGGNTVYLQQQDHSIEAIAARDARLIDASAETSPAQPPAKDEVEPDVDEAVLADTAKTILEAEFKELPHMLALPKPERAAR